jgi:hypothetical protein
MNFKTYNIVTLLQITMWKFNTEKQADAGQTLRNVPDKVFAIVDK